VTHEESLSAVQSQVAALVVTTIVPLPPVDATVPLDGLRVVEQPTTILIESSLGGETVPLLSRTVTLKVKGLPSEVAGVPLITPVEGFSVRPGGSVVAVQLLYGGVPPAADKGCE